ncbi:indole-3-glycerol phosphate synthase TrpC [Rugamonas sp. CCM 8940]|uniref:indole-3-glycerol phosphate synthase TrpC n=1 Tax=Rugamonas sp. CCM 8940 TaxID=2765359 RepID=UPI0018F5BF29|nr:indole-3-glycerol phosphate synthase TrpC [Rugamonas sp. CCM 8940]MBJ7311274.1 indole-3-glycerol phosphate synthase TrpC [Rugamonas sp. CCM 8940]
MLHDIVEYKRIEVREKIASFSIAQLELRAAQARPVREFGAALRRPGASIIAEVKYRSPSKGILRSDFDPATLAHAYQLGGARAISVLADSRFFGGGPFVVGQIANDAGVALPVMYKDFIVSEYQILEARAVGADAVLIIARIISEQTLAALLKLAAALGMEVLVETFDENDIDMALACGAAIVGINNRDLDTFKTDFARTERLFRRLPDGVVSISESGIASHQDMLAMAAIGFDGALIGETILQAQHPTAMIRQLCGDAS